MATLDQLTPINGSTPQPYSPGGAGWTGTIQSLQTPGGVGVQEITDPKGTFFSIPTLGFATAEGDALAELNQLAAAAPSLFNVPVQPAATTPATVSAPGSSTTSSTPTQTQLPAASDITTLLSSLPGLFASLGIGSAAPAGSVGAGTTPIASDGVPAGGVSSLSSIQPVGTPTSSTGNSTLTFVVLGVLGVGGFLLFMHHHHKAEQQKRAGAAAA
jgi:hypothetical protein